MRLVRIQCVTLCFLVCITCSTCLQPPSTDLSRPALSRREVLIGSVAGTWGGILLRAKSDEEQYAERKKRLFGLISGSDFSDVLEVGIGGNPTLGGFENIPYYRKGVHLIGLDPTLDEENVASSSSTGAIASAAAAGIPLSLVRGVAENLPFQDGAFDAVVTTLVMCSVKDQLQSLKEVARVLRPGGRYLFLEHIGSPEPGFLSKTQEVLDPLQILLASGCHLTRHTDRLIKDNVGANGQLFSEIELFEDFRVDSRFPANTQILGALVK